MTSAYAVSILDWPPGSARLVAQCHLSVGTGPRAPAGAGDADPPPAGLFASAVEAARLNEGQVRTRGRCLGRRRALAAPAGDAEELRLGLAGARASPRPSLHHLSPPPHPPAAPPCLTHCSGM
jgi:hypothetical protein